MEIIAKTLAGLENVLAEEIKGLGGSDIMILQRAVKYEGDQKVLYKSNLELRTALRILVPITRFKAKNINDFYNGVQNFYWDKVLDPDKTFAVDAVVNSELFRHSKYMALKTKDAIVDQLRDRTGSRPNIDVEDPDLRINLHIKENKCTISLDSSGFSLHKRGYRIAAVQAPLIETLAAGLILLSGWDKKTAFYDPMCGSGTFLIEAAKMAANQTPQAHSTSFGFMKWKNFNRGIWNEIISEAKNKEQEIECKIFGSDIDSKILNATRYNIAEAGFRNDIQLEKSDFFEKNDFLPNSTIIMNPPYDQRLKVEDITGFFKKIGDHMKNEMTDCSVWILSANIDAIKQVGLKPNRKITVYNGPNVAKFFKFQIYAGKKSHK